MKKISLATIARTYANAGMHAEQCACYTLTGIIKPHDNRPFWAGGDIGGLQVKSARATVCAGTDICAHLALDGATSYGYVTKDFKSMYIMSRDEYRDFVLAFGYTTIDSRTGETKTRLKHESIEMEMYLRKHTA